MTIFKLRILIFLFTMVQLGGCQIDDSLSKIKDSIVNIEFAHGDELKKKEQEQKNESDRIKNNNKIKEQTEKPKVPYETKKITNLENFEKENDGKKANDIENTRDTVSRKNDDIDKVKIQDLKEEKKSIFEILFGSKEEEFPNEINQNSEKTQEIKLSKKNEIDPIDQNNKQNNENLISDEEVLEQDIVLDQKDINSKTTLINNDEKLETESVDSQKKEIETSFLQLKEIQPIEKKKSRKFKKGRDSIGLLVPLSGSKSFAGEIVLNTIRYSIEKRPTKLKFKIYDTKGTSSGAIEATNKAVKDGVRVFIGPIFSDVTKVLKETFENKDLIFFSLSTDASNKSKKMIVTGQSPDDQIKCIAKNLVDKRINRILLIHHDDKYGDVVKNSLLNTTKNLNYMDQVELNFFKISKNQDLNQEIKILSKFEIRKEKLKSKIENINKSKVLSEEEKKERLKQFDRKLTLDVPFDSIIIASEGDKLLEILSHLAFYDINSNNTILYGTSIWEDSFKKDKIYENTFFVSNLKNEAFNFKKEYFEIFEKTPRTITFQLFDLIEIIKDFQDSELKLPEDKIYMGEFGNSFLKDGFLHRETVIKKVKNEKIINSSKCYLNVL